MLRVETKQGDAVVDQYSAQLLNCTQNAFKQVEQTELDMFSAEIKAAMCADPIHTQTSGTVTFGVEKFVALEFEDCKDRTDIDTESFCWKEEAVLNWGHSNHPRTKVIYSHNFIDFEDPDDPLKLSLTNHEFGNFQHNIRWRAIMPLEYHQVQLSDDIFDPFGLDTQEFPFLTPVKSDQFVYKEHNHNYSKIDWSIELHLNGYTRVQERTKYGVWDLLGDVGGFHDGMFLVAAIIIGPYQALAAKLDFTSGKAADNADGKRGRSFQNSDRFAQAARKISSVAREPSALDHETISVIEAILRRAISIQQSVKDHF